MKGDFTRSTFKKEKHYRGVHMQQGRVQVDADWNEQIDINAHRIETEAADVIGLCGAPLHEAGFELGPNGKDLEIGKGRYYVDGILCENEKRIALAEQPDLPDVEMIQGNGIYLGCLDVWPRHITALEDLEVREKALGGPDTATRTKTVWQVRLIKVGEEGDTVNCLSHLEAWDDLTEPATGKLAARVEESEEEDEPCKLAPRGGYRSLENQLYRVEVHKGGNLGVATFKWSRDNGSIVTRWEDQNVNNLTVAGAGRDKLLNLASGQWVELIDDDRELRGEPGILVKIKTVDGNIITIDPDTAIPAGTIDIKDFVTNPKLRRWDSDGVLKPARADWISLEQGIQIRLSAGSFKTGDYWLIPARTDEAEIEWPLGADDNGGDEPRPVLPHGIQHHYCRLALLELAGTNWARLSDCRRLFPPVTELTTLLYVGGDGQEAMPGKPLPKPLRVRVANGQTPVTGAVVQFTVVEGGGTLSPGMPISTAEPDGTAECNWNLGIEGSQQVTAELLDPAGVPVPGSFLEFNANLSVAGEVSYDPKGCTKWEDSAEIATVEDAINRLCMREQKVGCGATVGEGGNYTTLNAALEALAEADEIHLCLLPGIHELDRDLPAENGSRKNIKITGCGSVASVIQLKCERLSLSAYGVTLRDIGVNIVEETGGMVIDANSITAERCSFERPGASRNTGPMVLIAPTHRTECGVQWRMNSMRVAHWAELSIQLWGYLVPEGADIGDKLREDFTLLLRVNPNDRRRLERTIAMIARDIEDLDRTVRGTWFSARPRERIEMLPDKLKNPLNGFYAELDKRIVDLEIVAEAIKNALLRTYEYHNTDALALAEGVGGWFEDNTINGYFSIYHSSEIGYLKWGDIENIELRNSIQTWLESNLQINPDMAILNIRGNLLYSVRSNTPAIATAMNLMVGGEFSEEQIAQRSCKSLVIEGNTFEANGNSFLSESVFINGNLFKDTSGEAAAAYLIGESGTFMGNIPRFKGAAIDKFMTGGSQGAANLLAIW